MGLDGTVLADVGGERVSDEKKYTQFEFDMALAGIQVVQRERDSLRAALEGVERVTMDVMQSKSKHDVEILLGTLMGLYGHVREALQADVDLK